MNGISWKRMIVRLYRQRKKEKIFGRGHDKNTSLGLFLSREIPDMYGCTINKTGQPDKGARPGIMVLTGSNRIHTDSHEGKVDKS
ncbi:MAG TPA: hypothetical protein VMW77_07635 [Methanoregula sp.]|nr:hypothetical protein [Methanoregula sp.]